MERSMMTKRNTMESGNGDAMQAKSKRRGWLLIFAVALATGLFFVLGTLDADLRYDLIGI
jgi:hypothetical protein